MKVNGNDYRTVWMEGSTVCFIEQNLLPFEFRIYRSDNYLETSKAIKSMKIRGAGAIGAAAGFAMAQAFAEAPENELQEFVYRAKQSIYTTRPTARNLYYAVDRVFNKALNSIDPQREALKEAHKIAEEDALSSLRIGKFGEELIQDKSRILTHCNAGWLAFVDHGTALSPVYNAFHHGKDVFVYVDETKPRGQGAKLTAWELQQVGIPYKIIPDNAAAHLMSLGQIDFVIVGADRIAVNGDVANKIGTLSRAIAAREYNIPFYVAAPLSTFDIDCIQGSDIIIEERPQEEVLFTSGITINGKLTSVLSSAPGSSAYNPAFDITPAKFITAIITDKGIIQPDESAIRDITRQ